MNEQVKNNIMEYKQKYLQKLTDAQVPEKLEKQLEEMDWTCLELIHQKKQQRGTFAPLQATELSEIRKKEDLYRETGLKALREGKVGAILLAGGQGTRLGFDKAKGMFNIGVTKTLYIFEQLIKNLMQVKHEAGVWIPLYIMTSKKNDVQTRTFFEEHDFFGYDSSYVKFFVQEMVPAVDFEPHTHPDKIVAPTNTGSAIRCNTLSTAKTFSHSIPRVRISSSRCARSMDLNHPPFPFGDIARESSDSISMFPSKSTAGTISCTKNFT